MGTRMCGLGMASDTVKKLNLMCVCSFCAGGRMLDVAACFCVLGVIQVVICAPILSIEYVREEDSRF